MKFQKILESSYIPEWKHAYIDYKGLKKCIKELQTSESYNENGVSSEIFLHQVDVQFAKALNFFQKECATLQGKYHYLKNKIEGDVSGTNTNSQKKTLLKEDLRIMKDYYKFCEYLQNFQKLNRIAIAKIFKKFKKNLGPDLHEESVRFIDDAFFLQSDPKTYAQRAEDLFLVAFAALYPHRSRKDAMFLLKGHGKSLHNDLALFRVGLFIGLGVPLLIAAIYIVFSRRLYDVRIWNHVLYIYEGLFIVLLTLFGTCIDLYYWRKFHINYPFILDMDSKGSLSFKRFSEFTAISFLLFSGCAILTATQVTDSVLSFQYIPLVLIGSYVCLLCLPLPVLYYSSRKYFLGTIWRVVTPLARKVAFRDFFFADIACSLVFFYGAIYLTVCHYMTGGMGVCSPKSSWITPFLISIPLLIRALQCCRRYYDGKQKSDLKNFGKYCCAISAVFASFVGGLPSRSVGVLILWICVALVSAVYSYSWDCFKDWGLGKNREHVVHKRNVYIAAILNLLLRFTWILSINTALLFNFQLVAFLIGCTEVCRRHMWAFFRMEHEHVSNVEQYRAIQEIPILSEDNGDVTV